MLLTCVLGGCIARARLPTLDDGRQAYIDACASCHGIDGTGNGPVAPAFKRMPSDLTQLTRRHGGEFPLEFVIQTITGDHGVAAHGTRDMPVWSCHFGSSHAAGAVAAVYTRQRVEVMANYLESIQRSQK